MVDWYNGNHIEMSPSRVPLVESGGELGVGVRREGEGLMVKKGWGLLLMWTADSFLRYLPLLAR
jgi:hypothetical protein